MIKRIHDHIISQQLITEHNIIILGLSGGPDSVFLLHVLTELRKKINFSLIAAHLNHEWRDSAHNDAQLCEELCSHYSIPLISKKASDLKVTIRDTGSREDYGRRLRQAFFKHVAHEYHASCVALAHHADDQQETFLIRLLRGTTLNGLVGIKIRDGLYIRPLLNTFKEEILIFLHENSINYAIDPTNMHDIYLRNRIRNHAIPALKKCDTRFAHSFERTRSHLQKTEEFITRLTLNSFNHVTTLTNLNNKQYCVINLDAFYALDHFIQHRVLINWLIHEQVTFTLTEQFVDELMRFAASSKGGTHQVHTQWMLIKKKKILYIMHHQ
jgi:tRNA(Ile)-lysidine synthase